MSGVKKKKKKQEEQNVSKEVHKRTQVKEPKWNGEAKWQYFITFVCTTTKRMREIAVPSPSPTLLPTSRPPPPPFLEQPLWKICPPGTTLYNLICH